MTDSVTTRLPEMATGTPDFLDSLIYVTIVLFILSVITEKVTQLVRNYPWQFRVLGISMIIVFYVLIVYSCCIPPYHPDDITGTDVVALLIANTIFLVMFVLHLPIVKNKDNALGKLARRFSFMEDIRKGKVAPEESKARDVSVLSFILGFILTYIFNANLIEFLTHPGMQELGWKVSPFTDKYYRLNTHFFGFDPSMAIGFIVTGFFLSFGSKFFHDLLDTLLQVKNLKRKANEDATYQAETIEQFDEYMSKSSADVIQSAIAQNEKYLASPDLVCAPLQGRTRRNGKIVDCIDVHLKGTNRGDIPQFVLLRMEKGQVIKVPVNVIYEVETAMAHAAQGDEVAAIKTAAFKGTLCCMVKDEGQEILLLTCSHVMNDGKGKNDFGKLTKPVPANIAGEKGNFVWALCNDQFDVALIKPNDNNFTYSIPPKKERALTAADILSTKVKVIRQNGTIGEGAVVNHQAPRAIRINYKDGEFGIVNLIILSSVRENGDELIYEKLTDHGDSGACVYDEQNNPIGMVIAGNNKFTYAIPMPDILAKIKASIAETPIV